VVLWARPTRDSLVFASNFNVVAIEMESASVVLWARPTRDSLMFASNFNVVAIEMEIGKMAQAD